MDREYRYVGVTLEEAVKLMGDALCRHRGSLGVEEVPLEQALGRLTAGDAVSLIHQPPFDRSPLDGYALGAEDSRGACREHPVRLTVTQEIVAGDGPKSRIEPGQAARIMTGAPIPEGADCVIRQEDTDYGEETVAIYQEMKSGQNYCYAGEDFREGDCLLHDKTRLGAVELGILAAMGYTHVKVRREPRAAVFTTGDELAMPGEKLTPGKIYNSNLYVLTGRLRELGIASVIEGALPDTEQGVAETLSGILDQVDVIFTTGGVSVGKKDIMHGALELLRADKIFWRVKVKPGTPTIFAMLGEIPILALSGNPFGALTHMELLGRPLLARLAGEEAMEAPREQAILQDAFPKGGGMRRMVRGFFREGRVYLPQGLHSSGALGSMQGCNCLMDIPAGSQGLAAGQEVTVFLLEKGEELPWWMKQRG